MSSGRRNCGKGDSCDLPSLRVNSDLPTLPREVLVNLRRALGCFPTGVAIVTTCTRAGRKVGLTVNSFNSLSLEPPLVSWALRSSSPNRGAFLETPYFAVNVLAETQVSLSRRFADSNYNNKFEGLSFENGLGEVPLIPDCLARIECIRDCVYTIGDHDLLIGLVKRFECCAEKRNPLIYYRGSYRKLTDGIV